MLPLRASFFFSSFGEAMPTPNRSACAFNGDPWKATGIPFFVSGNVRVAVAVSRFPSTLPRGSVRLSPSRTWGRDRSIDVAPRMPSIEGAMGTFSELWQESMP